MNALQRLEAQGVLSMLDVELARGISRIAAETREGMQLALAFTSRHVQHGHVCLDLTQDHESLRSAALAAGVTLPSSAQWVALARSSSLVERDPEAHDSARPLVLDAKNRLYLARYHDHERKLADRLRDLAQGTQQPPPLAVPAIDWLFPPLSDGQPDLQRIAALAARKRRLSIIVGGPGTGKTFTVVKLLILLALDARTCQGPLPRVLLVAPTGKAAQRLTESIAQARARLTLDPELSAWLPSAAQTIHRALGSLEGSLTRFRHHAAHPLPCDVLLLDEASMVDLALMRRLFDALPAHARVILLGDPDQLASVEAGGVLSDLCQAAQGGGALTGCLTRLVESRRYASKSGIHALSDAVRKQDADLCLSLLRSGDYDDIALHAADDAHGAPKALLVEARRGYDGLKVGEIGARLRALSSFRVLCAHRRGRYGVDAINAELTRALRSPTTRAGESYPGRPILITQNDYGTELFNGDVGVVHAERGSDELALYLGSQEPPRRVTLGRLPAHETVYAMSVHKSQGSEFERVAVVLPERLSPVLTRELLFTAITRARSAVTIYGSPEVLRAAICQRVQRESGLSDRLL